jgi:non-ribosomal peptide synthetase component F
MARCSFDIHVQEIFGSLMIGAMLVMLRPRGTVDFEYLSTTCEKKQVTYMHTVPSLLLSFFGFIEKLNRRIAIQHLRSLCSSGE